MASQTRKSLPVNQVRSLGRRLELRTVPPSPRRHCALLVPAGRTDQQVLGWAAQCMDPVSLQELCQLLAAGVASVDVDVDVVSVPA
jgi:hypothetical protein